jgi:VanZ family protein
MSLQIALHYARQAAIWLFWPSLALVIWGELAPAGDIEIHIWDKLLHFTAYFGLAGMAWLALGGARRGWLAVFGLIVLGALLEIIQGQMGRDMSFWDEAANALGAGSAALAFLCLQRLVGYRPTD